MHTSLNDPAILVVFELVATVENVSDDSIAAVSEVGCGWGFISLFKHNVKSVDVANYAASPAGRYVVCICVHCVSLSVFAIIC